MVTEQLVDLSRLLFGLAAWYSVKGNFADRCWLLRAALWSLPLPWIACELGWFVAEYGRQPWTIYGVLPTHMSESTLSVASLYGSLAGFVGFYMDGHDMGVGFAVLLAILNPMWGENEEARRTGAGSSDAADVSHG